jgi:hypothetical protein
VQAGSVRENRTVRGAVYLLDQGGVRMIETLGHEPECEYEQSNGIYDCCCIGLRAAYRRGYNDHAASRAKAEQMYGPYNSRPQPTEQVNDLP